MWKSILQACLHFPINIITVSCGVLGPCINTHKPTHVLIENAVNLDWIYESRWRHSKYYQYQPENNFTSQKVTCVRSSAVIVKIMKCHVQRVMLGRLKTTTRKPALPGRALTKLWNERCTVAGRGDGQWQEMGESDSRTRNSWRKRRFQNVLSSSNGVCPSCWTEVFKLWNIPPWHVKQR